MVARRAALREGAVPKQKMNPDDVDIDARLVARLVATQFPQWGHLPLAEVRSGRRRFAAVRSARSITGSAVRSPTWVRTAR
jgi:hypothetical protein